MKRVDFTFCKGQLSASLREMVEKASSFIMEVDKLESSLEYVQSGLSNKVAKFLCSGPIGDAMDFHDELRLLCEILCECGSELTTDRLDKRENAACAKCAPKFNEVESA
jgi:hypothetical protein